VCWESRWKPTDQDKVAAKEEKREWISRDGAPLRPKRVALLAPGGPQASNHVLG